MEMLQDLGKLAEVVGHNAGNGRMIIIIKPSLNKTLKVFFLHVYFDEDLEHLKMLKTLKFNNILGCHGNSN